MTTCKPCSKVLPFHKLRTPGRNLKKPKSFHLCDLKCRQKLRPAIQDCYVFKFRWIYGHLTEALEGIYSRFVQNVKIAKPTFSTRHGDIRTMVWACAICHLFENFLPAASYSRRVSDLQVPNVARQVARKCCLYYLTFSPSLERIRDCDICETKFCLFLSSANTAHALDVSNQFYVIHWI